MNILMNYDRVQIIPEDTVLKEILVIQLNQLEAYRVIVEL